jgi:hypothetical protein
LPEKHMAGKLKPLDVEREDKPGGYPDGDDLYLIAAGPAPRGFVSLCYVLAYPECQLRYGPAIWTWHFASPCTCVTWWKA